MDNQSLAILLDEVVLVNTSLTGFSVNPSGNRWQEDRRTVTVNRGHAEYREIILVDEEEPPKSPGGVKHGGSKDWK